MSFSRLRDSVAIEGVGIHTGQRCRVTIEPGDSDDPILFRRNRAEIAAWSKNVTDTSRCTRISASGESISTVEHLMSAFAGLDIRSATVVVDGPELPILDGSAKDWVDALRPLVCGSGRPLSRPIDEAVRVEGKHGSFIEARPAEKLSIALTIAYDHPVIGVQTACFTESDDYEREIAPARTFGLRSEVDALLAAGLAKGGSLDNAIVVEDDGYSAPLRFENELARHKVLDMLGDLYLSGNLPRADIIAVKPSHTLNVALASKLTEVFVKNWKSMPEGY